jgi:moderate conductance mechanosensitive channel
VRSTVAGTALDPLARVRERTRERLSGSGEEHALPVRLRRTQRAETTGSLLRNVASVLVYGVAFVLVLGELGVNLAPIVASAGIVGVAVGFGAQNLVRDFLTGIFMILEDQYGVGDVVDLGRANGTVEAVGLRTTRVRDVAGTVWHVRNGDIAAVGNKSQAWARALIDVPVAYASDLHETRTVIKEAADAVWKDPDYAPKILEEPEVWGAESFDADAVVVRLVVKTVPLEQWVVARALRESIKNAFDAAGIEIPFAQRSVWVRHSDDDGPDLGVAVTQVPRRDPSTTGPLPIPQHSGASEQGGS